MASSQVISFPQTESALSSFSLRISDPGRVVPHSGSRFLMQLHQIDLVPGQAVQVGNFTVTLVAVEEELVQLHVRDSDNNDFWSDPFVFSDAESHELALA